MAGLKGIEDHKTFGSAVLSRLEPVPKPLKTFLADFADLHGRFLAAAKVADVARKTRDEVLGRVASADDAQDAAVDALADALVGAKLGDRKNPFSTFTHRTPAELKALPYKVEATEIGSLAHEIEKKGSSDARLKAALATATKAAGAVLLAIEGVTYPQLAYDKSLGARDAILPEWTVALNRLRKHAAAFWADDVAAYRAVFAPPEKVAAPKKVSPKTKAARAAKRAAKKAAKGGSLS